VALPLDETLTAGDTGHLADHMTLADLVNDIASGSNGDIVYWNGTRLVTVTRAALAADAALTAALSTAMTPLVTGRYYRVPNGSVSTSAALGNGTLRVVRKYIPTSTTITRIGAEVTVIGDVGSKFRIGIYADSSGRPGALVLDAGQINGDSATVQEITISQALTPGWYWFGGVVQSVVTTQPTVRVLATPYEPLVHDLGTSILSAGLTSLGASVGGVTGALPNPFGTVGTAGNVPSIFVKA
jgi:hypothetical protein